MSGVGCEVPRVGTKGSSSKFEQKKSKPRASSNYLGTSPPPPHKHHQTPPPLTLPTTYLHNLENQLIATNHPRNQRSRRRLSEGQDTAHFLNFTPFFFSSSLPLQNAFENGKAGAEGGCGYSCSVRQLRLLSPLPTFCSFRYRFFLGANW